VVIRKTVETKARNKNKQRGRGRGGRMGNSTTSQTPLVTLEALHYAFLDKTPPTFCLQQLREFRKRKGTTKQHLPFLASSFSFSLLLFFLIHLPFSSSSLLIPSQRNKKK
jgi:hypothetical protein